jgi:hypothetical protein
LGDLIYKKHLFGHPGLFSKEIRSGENGMDRESEMRGEVRAKKFTHIRSRQESARTARDK